MLLSSAVLRTLFSAGCMICALLVVPGARVAGADQGEKLEIVVLSTRPDTVTGGDVLAQINAGESALQSVEVTLNGRDVTSAFRPGPVPGTLVGLVEGLSLGKNTLRANANGHVKVELVNHPITGPVFSGTQQMPFICETEVWGLGPALDEQCSANTQVTYQYRSTTGTFRPLPAGPPPADLARTTTTEGATVDYIVRLERGTVNRAVYEIALLHTPGQPLPDPWTSTSGWNGRLVYTFGGGYRAAYHQGRNTGGVMNDLFLRQGYAVASGSLNVAQNNANDVISAETAMMVKERFIERFGAPRYTIGWGTSGGAMQQHMLAQNYPGILDGIVPAAASPDTTTRIPSVTDCSLLARYFSISAHPWTEEQKTAVSGFANWQACTGGPAITGSSWIPAGYSPGWVSPKFCDLAIPVALVYDAVTNPAGVRCTIQDDLVNSLTRDPKTGFARRALDSVGVQYGLTAFNAGAISAEQFIELNERIGGYDIDGNIVAARSVADQKALNLIYETGRVNTASGGFSQLPILDLRTYTDPFDFHDRIRIFSTRARMIQTNGHADNRVSWTFAGPGAGPPAQFAAEALRQMDRWLANIAADRADDDPTQKVVRNKPADLVDGCWTPAGQRVDEPAVHGQAGVCNGHYPPHADPRIVAGAPVALDILKCRLKRVNRRDYSAPLTDDQFRRLTAIFRDGACDFSRPGKGQRLLKETWHSFPVDHDDD